MLDLGYGPDVQDSLGEHGVINLAGLNELVKVRLPLRFLVEMPRGQEPFVTNLGLVLPPSVKDLTVWAAMESVGTNGRPTFTNDLPYRPRQSVLDFLRSVSGRTADHFRALKKVTYCYGGKELSAACRCDNGAPCSHCEASEALDPHAVDDSLAWLQILSSRLEDHGVSFCALQEQEKDQRRCPRSAWWN